MSADLPGPPATEAETRQRLIDEKLAPAGWDVTEDLLRRVYDHRSARFIQFIKHILGLERLESWSETVARAFDDFIAQHNTYSASQIRFLQTLRTFILQTGTVDRENLIEAPFTQIHTRGVRGLFQPAEIEEILSFTRTFAA